MMRDFQPFRVVLCGLISLACVSSLMAQAPHADKVMGGYFEEWGIHYGGFTIADLQRNGVADRLTHLIYAFGDVTPASTPACATGRPPCAAPAVSTGR